MLGSYRKDNYRAIRIWAVSSDGTQVISEHGFCFLCRSLHIKLLLT